jgi:uncharacterized protein
VPPIPFEFDVHVRPGASRTRIDGVHGGVLAVRVAAPPADGRANDAVCAALAAAFDVRPSAVSIVRGSTSRRKRIRIEGDSDHLEVRLKVLMDDRSVS